MQPGTEPRGLDILYVSEHPPTSEQLEDELGLPGDGQSVETVSSASHLSEGYTKSPDCVLVEASTNTTDCLEHVEVLRRQLEDVPILVFTAQHDELFIERLLQAGAADVVQSTLEGTPPALVRRRIESILENDRRLGAFAQRYDTILNTAADAIYQLDPEGYVVSANDAAVELLGYEQEELLGRHASDFQAPENVEEGEQLIAELLEADDPTYREQDTVLETKEGEKIPCETRVAIWTKDGELAGSVGVVRDVSEKREKERELRQRNELLTHISENLSDVVWVNTPSGDIEFVSEAFEDIWGLPVEAAYENTDAFIERVHPDDRRRVQRAHEQKFDDPDSYNETYRVVHPGGEVRWVQDRGFGVFEDGELRRIVGIAKDITELKEREKERERNREFLQQTQQVADIGGWEVDLTSMTPRWTEEVYAVHGMPADYEPTLEEAFDFYHEEDQPKLEEAFEKLRTEGEPYDLELRLERGDGQLRWVRTWGEPVYEDGELVAARGVLRDIHERKLREQRLEEQRNELAQLDRINHVIRDVDQALLGADTRKEVVQAVCNRLSSSGRYEYVSAIRPAGESRLELEAASESGAHVLEDILPLKNESSETDPGLRVLDTGETQTILDMESSSEFPVTEWREQLLEEGVTAMAMIPIAYMGQHYGILSVSLTTQSFTERELDVLDELGETVGYAIAAVESREREAILTSLYEATQDLLAAETPQEVCDVVVETAADVLEQPGIGIFLFDDENVLRPASATRELLDYYAETKVFGPGEDDSIAWQTYVSGETQFFSDIHESDHLANPNTSAKSALLLPLGDHGVFVVATPEQRRFGDELRRLIGVLATTTEAALDRVAGKVGIREREKQLERRRTQLQQFEGMFSFMGDVDRLLRRAGTREEIEQGVCEEIVEIEPYELAWIGTVPPGESTVEPRAWAGEQADYLDDVSFVLDSDEPASRTARTGSETAVGNITERIRESVWAREAVERGYQSVLSVPLVYGDATYGVFTVYADSQDAFDEIVRPVLSTLGSTIAHGINTVETKRGILTEQVVELELDIGEPDTFLNAVASATGEEVSYREITPESDGSAYVLFELSDPPVGEVLALEAEFVAVDSLTHVKRGDKHLFRATLRGPTVAATLLDCGSIPQEVAASADSTHAVVRIPRELDVRVFLDRVRANYPETELVARRDVERSVTRPESVRLALEEDLTDRQREVLVTAYEGGYFQSPRETTGEELGNLLDLSQPTVTHHLREAQRRLFETLFEEMTDEATGE